MESGKKFETVSYDNLRRMAVFRCADGVASPEEIQNACRNGLSVADRDLTGLPESELQQVVISLLKPSRVAHVLGCRDTAVQLAQKWGANVSDAARAALLHDVTKALDGPLQLTLCEEYGTILGEFSKHNPKTLHALTGSLVAERIFGENKQVVDAICSHTTGKADMNTLEKIIYIADYMEPNRDFPGVEKLRDLAYRDLDKALKTGLEMTLEMLKKNKQEISPASAEAIAFLEQAGV